MRTMGIDVRLIGAHGTGGTRCDRRMFPLYVGRFTAARSFSIGARR
jgi:hypothetical protein